MGLASINDCTQFNYIIPLLEEYNQSNILMRTDTLKEIYVSNLEDGIFYEDSQKIYYLETPDEYLNDDYTYKLILSYISLFSERLPEPLPILQLASSALLQSGRHNA